MECFHAWEAQEALKAKRDAAWDVWKKRVDSLIKQWRNRRLKTEDKYKEEFDKAAAKFKKKVGDDYGTSIINEARGRMEGAIADRERAERQQKLRMEERMAVFDKHHDKVEGAVGTKLRLEAANAAYGEKKVSKKVYQRILTAVEKYQTYWRTQMPPMPVRPESATEVCEHDGEPGVHSRGMIISTSPEYDAWIAADQAAHQTPEYLARDAESRVIGKLWSSLVLRYDPLKEGDLDGDDEEFEEEGD